MQHNHSNQFLLTASQRQMYAGQCIDPDSPLYNTILTNRILGAVCKTRFELAWNKVVAENSALRARITIGSEEPVQIFPPTPGSLQHLDFSDHAEALQAANEWIAHDSRQIFELDLTLFSVALIKLSADRWIWYCNQHHLITDALSFQSIWSQLCSHYLNGTTTHPDETPAGDFQHFLATRGSIDLPLAHSASNGTASSSHWASRAEAQPVRMYHGRQKPSTTRSCRIQTALSNQRMLALNALAQSAEARSLNAEISKTVVLMATMFCFLFRTSNQNTLTIGSPTAYRSNRIYKNTAGPFFEVLPLQVEVESDNSFADVLKKTRAEIMRWLRFAEDNSSDIAGQSSINVVVNFIYARMCNLGDIPVETEWRHPDHADRHHALRLHIADWQNTGQLQLYFDFNEAHFDEALRKNAITQWLLLFDAMCTDTQQPVGAVDLLEPTVAFTKKEEVGHRGHETPTADTTARSDSFTNVIQHITHACFRHSDKNAVTQQEKRLDYRTLAQISSILAAKLTHRGIGSGDRVCVFVEQSLLLPAILLGVMKSGAAYVPLDSSLPGDRIQFIVNNSLAKLVVTQMNLVTKLNSECPYLLIDETSITSTQESNEYTQTKDDLIQDLVEIDSRSTAYVMYTSGSTGQPKGVVVSHGALYNYCRWATSFYCGNKQLTFPLFTSPGFDLTVTSLFPPLMSGGTIRVYGNAEGEHQTTLFSVIDENAVDIIKLTPAHLSLVQHYDFSHSKIAQIIVGGEDLKHHLASSIHHAFKGNVVIHNEYGPTEATVGCVVSTYDPAMVYGSSVPIGKPVANMQTWVLNEHSRNQPDGVPGELYLSGPSLAEGYWNDKALTTAAFLTDQSISPTILYRTGDIVQSLPDGQLTYLGRRDDQIKINGVRIEPGEIESAMMTHPDINACVATTVHSEIQADVVVYCTRCAVSSQVPGVTLNSQSVCSTCEKYEHYKERAHDYFASMDELHSIAAQMKQYRESQYDCMMLLSGGKDSTYALARLADMNLSVLAFTLDNGFISSEAKKNISRVCDALGVDHVFGSTQFMNQIFADSLDRHSNVCHGCFKTIYTLSMKVALERNIPFIVTGLSRGQFFETRLTEELFTSDTIGIGEIDSFVTTARKAYHQVDDAVHRLLDVSQFDDESIFDQITFIDFYRYCDVNLDEMLDYLTTRVPWIRPSDTGRSTNCLINDVGIYVHKLERGYHNYEIPYSWDVRLGHKEREAALDELSDDIDLDHVNDILQKIGYQCKKPLDTVESSLAAYYVADKAIPSDQVRDWLSDRLPGLMIPTHFIQLPDIPLSANGKVNKEQLPLPSWKREGTHELYREPRSPLENTLTEVWQKYLKIDRIGIDDNFFELGGDSLIGIKIISRLNQLGYRFTPAQLFSNQTIARLATTASSKLSQDIKTDTPKVSAFAALKPGQLDKLSKLLDK